MRAMAAALVLAFCAPGAALAQAPAPYMVDVGALKPVSAHVQVIPDGSRGLVANIGFIVGTKGVLVVDTGLGPRNGAAVAEVARRIAPGRTIWLVATHAHPEHDLGAVGFPAGSRLVRSTGQVAAKQADLDLADVFRSRAPAIAELLQGADFRPADITFTGVYDLDLGGVSARMEALGPAHTTGDTSIWVAEDRVMFSGDLAMKAQPSIATTKATPDSWRFSLERLESFKPLVVVPSHGPIGDAGYIRSYRTYLAEVDERAANAKAAGQPLDAAVETVWQAMKDRYPDRGRLAGAVAMSFR